jgi:ATPase subunit of ABC transporter with duplicated ATPase domains
MDLTDPGDRAWAERTFTMLRRMQRAELKAAVEKQDPASRNIANFIAEPDAAATAAFTGQPATDDGSERQRLRLTAASSIKVRPVHWRWEGRIPLGEISLLAGREGIGKSTIAYTLAAAVTKGELKGRFEGQRGRSLWPRPRTPGSTPSSLA